MVVVVCVPGVNESLDKSVGECYSKDKCHCQPLSFFLKKSQFIAIFCDKLRFFAIFCNNLRRFAINCKSLQIFSKYAYLW